MVGWDLESIESIPFEHLELDKIEMLYVVHVIKSQNLIRMNSSLSS